MTSSQDEVDKQFDLDLEKALALSIETMALDKFKRNKIYNSYGDSTSRNVKSQISLPETQSAAYLRQRSRPDTNSSSSQNTVLAPPPIVPPRRYSEHTPPPPQPPPHTKTQNLTPKSKNETDLISFTSPTSASAANLAQMCEQIHKNSLQLQQIEQKTYRSNSLSTQYGFQASVLPQPGYNQIVPYVNQFPTVQQPQQQQQSKTLTSEQITQLYNVNTGAYSMQQQPRPFQSVQPMPTNSYQSPVPEVTVPSNFMSQFPSQNVYYPYGTAPSPSSNFENKSFIAVPTPQANNGLFNTPPNYQQQQISQNVANPESALVYVPKIPVSSNFKQFVDQTVTPSTSGILMPLAQSTSASTVNNSSFGGESSGYQRRSGGTEKKKSGKGDLIDLDNGIAEKVSVLEEFDPLLSVDAEDDLDDDASECTYYSEHDPFDYLYSGGTQYSDPVYDAVNKTDINLLSPGAGRPIGWNVNLSTSTSVLRTAPPLPPRNLYGSTSNYNLTLEQNQQLDRRKPKKLYENVINKKCYDAELMSFFNMIVEVRSQYKFNDLTTNLGYIVAAEFENQFPEGTSIKLLVHPAMMCLNRDNVIRNMAGSRVSSIDGATFNNGKGQIEGYGPPVVFTCDINTTVEHVISHIVCQLEGQIIGNVCDFMLKPIGVVEWLSPTSKLNQLECIHSSIKMEKDVQLGLCPKSHMNTNSIARTRQDDLNDAEIRPEHILPHEPVSSISHDTLMILLETLETEIDKLESAASDLNRRILSHSGVVQAVKMICALLGSIDTLEISDAVDQLKEVCNNGHIVYKETSYVGGAVDILSDAGDYVEVSIRSKSTIENITDKCHKIRNGVQSLLEIYTTAFRVDFCVPSDMYEPQPRSMANVSEPVMVHVMSLHRIPLNWKHEDYRLGVQILHGTCTIGDTIVAQCSSEISGLCPRFKFDSWITFDKIPVCTLPRESRLIFVLYGCTTEPADDSSKDSGTNDVNQEKRIIKVELGWSSIQFFDFERNMIDGSFLLSLWPPTTDKYLGPSPPSGTHPNSEDPVLAIEIPNYGGRLVFPTPILHSQPAPILDFNSLDTNLQQELIDTAELGYPSNALDKREVLWEKRYYLQSLPHALPKVLHAAHSWDFASLVDLHALIQSWQPLKPLQALELLLPRYPDLEVRSQAVKWLSPMPNDQLVDFLPQILQALKHDTYEASPLSRLLLSRSLESPRIAHHLYWLLIHSLPGDSPQNSLDMTSHIDEDESLITQARYHRRNQMMLRALLAMCGEKLSGRLLAQNMMCKSLAEVAQNVKLSKESHRQSNLQHGLEAVNHILRERPTSLPLGPGLEVTEVNIKTCGYFNSNTLPLKINFVGPDAGILPAIFKCGDDLQQDMLTLQLVRIMDKLWLKEGLDLKMVTFSCIPTGHKKGMIELVSDAETLRKIQVEWGLTGSFKDKPIAEWLARQNPSQLEYQRAVDNFTASCAGYSVATYILGICDRHNDNIMLKTSGHLFHIDFGKFLGDAQMFGNFKRDRTPFVLTSDMAYVINGGDKPSTKFHHFVDLCCKAFNIVRKHGDLLLHLLALMATSGIPGVTADAVTYVRNALLPGQSNPEAAASFAKMIHISLKSWFTQFNFFLHNLAQIRFTADEGSGDLLSFVPRTYTMAQDGRLKSVTVHGFQKRYDLEKYYTYILKVTRQNQPDPAYLFRSYKEFSEFHQKMCLHYPLAKLHSLPSGIHVGRSNIKTVAERRIREIKQFLLSLFNAADEIAHSDIVYTFFHPLLRDQQEADIHVKKVKEIKIINNSTERVSGEIKLSFQYHRGAFTVMIHHARSLPETTSGQKPNTYVKCYLKPDPSKGTKRKTKVIRKNCFPSFMETLEYRMPLEIIQNRILEVTVWSHDSLQENEFLGGIQLLLNTINLKDEFIEWLNLGYLPRT